LRLRWAAGCGRCAARPRQVGENCGGGGGGRALLEVAHEDVALHFVDDHAAALIDGEGVVRGGFHVICPFVFSLVANDRSNNQSPVPASVLGHEQPACDGGEDSRDPTPQRPAPGN